MSIEKFDARDLNKTALKARAKTEAGANFQKRFNSQK